MATRVALLSRDQIDKLPDRAREVVEYRKSGLSLNHIQGCPLDCAYCIRHTYGLWDQRVPRALMPDAQAVEELVTHRYFQPHVTPVQVFNRATDPFLPVVRPHTFAVLEDLDERELTNHVLVITRHQMKPEDIERLNQLRHIKLTLLFTYSGIDNKDVANCPPFEVITGNVLAALDADSLVAHNAHVDLGVLSRKLTGWEPPEVFDTLKLARRLVPGLDSYRLGNLVEMFSLAEGLPDDLNPHRATYDALVAARLFVLLATKAHSLEVLRGQPPKKVDEDALF